MPVLTPGQIIHERYQLQRLIGRGGFSVAWLAIDLQSSNQASAVLKISLPDRDPGNEMPARMEEQFATTRQLKQDHLLLAREYFKVEDAGCLVFDYMAQGTLHQKVRENGPLPESEVAKVIFQIGSALQYLHEHALVHFDVKPENILVDSTGNYFLSDFDTTSHLENSMVRVSRIYADTPQYRSPEHLRGAAELSEKADIFAFGTTIFELCEGLMEKEFGIGMHLLAGNSKPQLQNTAYAKRLEQLIHACWNHNPSDRPSAEALTEYGSKFVDYSYWPTVIEYREDDKPLADLPGSQGAETARITIGRPTVKVDYDAIKPEDESMRSTALNTSSDDNQPPVWTPPQPPAQPVKVKDQPARMNTSTRNRILTIIALILLAGGGYFGWSVYRHRQFNDLMQQARTAANGDNMPAAMAAVEKAKALFPKDSSAILLRREILATALQDHQNDLNLVQEIIDKQDKTRYQEMVQLLSDHRANAAILKGDDHTEEYIQKIRQLDVTIVIPPPPSPKPGDQGIKKDEKQTDPINDQEDEELKKELERIKADNDAWATALTTKTIEGFEAYKTAYTLHSKEADEQIRILKESIVKPPEPVVEKEEQYGIAGVSFERDNQCRQLIEGGSVVITPKVDLRLTELIVSGDSKGKVTISIQGAGLSKSITSNITSDRSQCPLVDLRAKLKAGNRYTLTVTPVRDATSGRMPLLDDIFKCNPNVKSSDQLDIDYNGKYFLFDLKYNYLR